MARRRYAFDEDKIARFQKEGRGRGRGTSYKPWLTIQDVASHGRSQEFHQMKTAYQPLITAFHNWRHEILAYFDWRLTNACAESANNLIRVANRMGRGYSFECCGRGYC